MLSIRDAAEHIGFKTMCVSISFLQLAEEAPLPSIVHWKQNHFVVVYEISKKGIVNVADPAFGLLEFSKEEFEMHGLVIRIMKITWELLFCLRLPQSFMNLKAKRATELRLHFYSNISQPTENLL